MKTQKIAIIGAGLAGASTAWWLARQPGFEIAILERESAPGRHATAQNAAMARQATFDPFTTRLLVEGCRWMAEPPPGFSPRPILRNNGSLLIGGREPIQKLHEVMLACAGPDEVELIPPERIHELSRLPEVRSAHGLLTKTDGNIDVPALLAGYLSGAVSAGAHLRVNCDLRSARRAAGVWQIDACSEQITADTLVIAGGAWAGALGELCGSTRAPLKPTRRHLFVTDPGRPLPDGGPFVWDVDRGVYVRPGERVFWSACDEETWNPRDPLRQSDQAYADLLEKLKTSFPGLKPEPLTQSWAGLRTLTPDGRFIIGWDPKQDGLFWVAGLGGHGVTASPAAGRIAASAITGAASVPPELDPSRF